MAFAHATPFLSLLTMALMVGCTSGETSAPPSRGSTGQVDSGPFDTRADVKRTVIRQSQVAGLPRLEGRLPRRVPAADADLPSLLEDPPSRVLMTYHPPEGQYSGPQGWATEDIMFYGEDRRWRVLHMEDLGLTASSWVGDSYGAGSLSSDGRWWAGWSREGPVILNLATGERVSTTIRNYTTPPTWVPGEHTLLVTHMRGGAHFRTELISVPTRVATRTPYRGWQVAFALDGAAISLRRDKVGDVRLVTWEDDQPVPGPVLPAFLMSNAETWGVGLLPTRGHLLKVAADSRHTKIWVVDSETGALDASLTWRSPKPDTELVQGWLDSETVLIAGQDRLVAWRPESGQVFGVTRTPHTTDSYWHLDIVSNPNLLARSLAPSE